MESLNVQGLGCLWALSIWGSPDRVCAAVQGDQDSPKSKWLPALSLACRPDTQTAQVTNQWVRGTAQTNSPPAI